MLLNLRYNKSKAPAGIAFDPDSGPATAAHAQAHFYFRRDAGGQKNNYPEF